MLLTNSFAGTEEPEDAEACSKWTRPPPPDLNTAKDNVVFQQIDVDHYIGNV
jgi:DNA polymerase delta subunit 1